MSVVLTRYIKKTMNRDLIEKYNDLIERRPINKMTKEELIFIIFVNDGEVLHGSWKKSDLLKKIPLSLIRDQRLKMIMS